jgi:two-component system sensor histidine kinase KdpD
MLIGDEFDMPVRKSENVVRLLSRVSGSLMCVAAITLAYSRLLSVNNLTVALTMLLAVLAIASRWGLIEAIVASLAGTLCFNLFFLPPVGTLTIADPQNWVALFAFLCTAVAGSKLSTSVKRNGGGSSDAAAGDGKAL